MIDIVEQVLSRNPGCSVEDWSGWRVGGATELSGRSRARLLVGYRDALSYLVYDARPVTGDGKVVLAGTIVGVRETDLIRERFVVVADGEAGPDLCDTLNGLEYGRLQVNKGNYSPVILNEIENEYLKILPLRVTNHCSGRSMWEGTITELADTAIMAFRNDIRSGMMSRMQAFREYAGRYELDSSRYRSRTADELARSMADVWLKYGDQELKEYLRKSLPAKTKKQRNEK